MGATNPDQNPTAEEERQRALELMYSAVRQAKERNRHHSTSGKVMDYMIGMVEQTNTEARQRMGERGGTYYGEFATELAELVAKLATDWTT